MDMIRSGSKSISLDGRKIAYFLRAISYERVVQNVVVRQTHSFLPRIDVSTENIPIQHNVLTTKKCRGIGLFATFCNKEYEKENTLFVENN